MKIDLPDLQELISEKYISVQKHPTEDFYIYNYTQKTQFDGKWIPTTMICRGLILDGAGNVVARPFPKFFNLEQTKDVPVELFKIYEKLDGSLGILYWIGDKPFLATRGSFASEQAERGSRILHESYSHVWPHLDKTKTYLFEIIYPENRIVVDYRGIADIVLLAVVDTATGQEEDKLPDIGFEKAAVYGDEIQCPVSELKDLAFDNKEGFVIKFFSGLRVKIKFDEYVRLHRIVTQINSKHIWELLMHKQPLNEILERVPDEFFKWVQDTIRDLNEQFEGIEDEAKDTLARVEKENFDTRKQKALFIQEYSEIPSVVFQMLDKRDYAQTIWRMIKPKAEKPFKQQDESNA